MGFADGAEVLVLEASLESSAQDQASYGQLHGLGLLRILQKRFDEGIELLEAASLQEPQSAEILTDLSLAHLERGTREGDPRDFLGGVEAAMQATRIAPERAAPWLNLGLLLDELGLRNRAADSLARVLELDPSLEAAPWVRRRLQELKKPSRKRWPILQEEVTIQLARGKIEVARSLIQEDTSQARRYVEEEALRLWASALSSRDDREARRALELAELVGSISAIRDQDRLIADGLELIQQASSSARLLEDLVAGHLHLGEGIGLRRRGDCDRAQAFLAIATERLRRAGSPFAALSRLNSLICLYYEDATRARLHLEDLRAEVSRGSYPGLLGRIDWMLGRSEAASGDYWAASKRYRSALAAFLSSNDRVGTAGIYALLSEAHQLMGEIDRSWDFRLQGLRVAADLGAPEELDRVLEETVLALIDEGRLDLALLIQDEQRFHVQRVPARELSLASLLTLRARLLRDRGEVREALENLKEARRSITNTPADATRLRLEADIRAEEALLLAATEPGRAIPAFAEVLATYDDINYRARLPELLHGRSQAHLALDREAAAELDLHRALTLLEQRRRDPSVEETRISAFERAQPIFDSAIRFYLEVRGDSARALEIAERAKSRALLDRLEENAPARPGLASRSSLIDAESTVETIQRSLPDGVVLVEFAVLPEALATWVVDRQSVRSSYRPITRDALARRTELFRRALDGRAPAGLIDSLATELFKDLMGPILDGVPPGTSLVIVPDRFLVGLPFPALRDARSRKYLVETHPVAVAPSGLFLSARPVDLRARREVRTALVVGNPAFDRDLFPYLEPLPLAEEEAHLIAALYPGAEVLVGHRATDDAVRTAIRGKQILHLATHALTTLGGEARLILASEGKSDPKLVPLLLSLGTGGPSPLELVFFSTCRSALAVEDGGREGLAGLARNLVGTGVPAVIGTLWKIDDRATVELAVAFHRRLRAGEEPITALQEAQVEMLGHKNDRYHSPATWAGFELFTGSWPMRP